MPYAYIAISLNAVNLAFRVCMQFNLFIYEFICVVFRVRGVGNDVHPDDDDADDDDGKSNAKGYWAPINTYIWAACV